jgi:uncharacterized membrane protein HdeD (DUF308 family)
LLGGNIVSSKIKKTKKSYWAYIMLGIILIIGGVILAPFWGKVWEGCPWKDYGIKFINYAMAFVLLIYLFGFLIKKIKRSSGTIQVLTILEFTLLFLIALGLVFSGLKILNIPDEPSKILGIALYIRGVTEIFRAYYYKTSETNKYPVWWLVVSIMFITFGSYFIFKGGITKETLLWVLAGAVFVFGIILLSYGIAVKPEKKNKKSK